MATCAPPFSRGTGCCRCCPPPGCDSVTINIQACPIGGSSNTCCNPLFGTPQPQLLLLTIGSGPVAGGYILHKINDNLYQSFLSDDRLKFFRSVPNIVDGYNWRSVPWQLENGVPPLYRGDSLIHVPNDMKHPAHGYHQTLNKFLVDYITQWKLLAQ